MKNTFEKNLTIIFTLLSVLFVIIMSMSDAFFDWSFARHHNILSWYIRPIFLIPFAFFSFKKKPVGIAVTVLLLLTSMFWFPEPSTTNAQVSEFLQMEKEYLTSGWTMAKVFFAIVVFFSMGSLCYSLWHRNKKAGIVILVLIAFGKLGWSVMEGGESGTSIIIPATVGLVVCIAFVYYVFKRMDKKTKE